MTVDRIENKAGQLLALVIRKLEPQRGIHFYTDPDDPLQIGAMIRPGGHHVQAHVHSTEPRTLGVTAEILFVRKGVVRVTLFGSDLDETGRLESILLSGGDVILLAAGGHSIDFVTTAEIVEVKQGPYRGEDDKTRKEEKSDAALRAT